MLSSLSHVIRRTFFALYGYHRIPPTLTTTVPRRVFPHLSHMTILIPDLPNAIGSFMVAVTHFLGLPFAIGISPFLFYQVLPALVSAKDTLAHRPYAASCEIVNTYYNHSRYHVNLFLNYFPARFCACRPPSPTGNPEPSARSGPWRPQKRSPSP